MNSFKSVADFASAGLYATSVLGLSTIAAIAYAAIATIVKRNGNKP